MKNLVSFPLPMVVPTSRGGTGSTTGLLTFTAGQAITAANYSIGRDNAGTNNLALNVPTGAAITLCFNGTALNTYTGTGGTHNGTMLVNNTLTGYNITTTAITPPGACTAALVLTSGNLSNGAYTYEVTFTTSAGTETKLGTVSNSVTVDGTHQQIALTGIPTGPMIGGGFITGRKVYRTKAAGSVYFLVATIADNTTTTLTDNVADASVGAQALVGGDTTGGITVGGVLATQGGITLASSLSPATTGAAVTYINNNGSNLILNVGANTMGFAMTSLGSQFMGIDSHGSATFTPTASTSGNHSAFQITPANNTLQSAGVEQIQFAVNGASIAWANGTVALQRYAVIGKLAVSGTTNTQVFTQAEGLNVSPPATSSNARIGTLYGINVNTNVSMGAAVAGTSYAAYSAGAHTLTITGTTQVTSQDMSMMRLDVLTITDSNAITIDSAATLTIVGAPVAASSATLTNAYSINVKAGLSRFTGGIDLSGVAAATAAMILTATSDTPSTTFSAVNATNSAPAGFHKITVGGNARYVPFYS